MARVKSDATTTLENVTSLAERIEGKLKMNLRDNHQLTIGVFHRQLESSRVYSFRSHRRSILCTLSARCMTSSWPGKRDRTHSS